MDKKNSVKSEEKNTRKGTKNEGSNEFVNYNFSNNYKPQDDRSAISYEIEYIDDNNNLNNDENVTKSDKNEIKDLMHDSNNSSFCLIFDSKEEKNELLNLKDTMSKRKFSSLSNGYETTEDCSPRNSYMMYNYRTNDNSNEETISLNSN